MELTGRVVAVLQEQRFNGKNGEVVKNCFILQTNGQYPKNVAFNVIDSNGHDKWSSMRQVVVVNANVVVSFEVSSREYNGKWFTQCDAYRVNLLSAPQQQAVPQSAATSNSNDNNNGGDPLPF